MWVPNGDEDKPKWYLVVASCKTMKEAEDYIKDDIIIIFADIMYRKEKKIHTLL